MINPEIFEFTGYINDINQEYTEVLMTTDSEGNYRGAYTYANGERISVEDLGQVEGVPNDPLYYLYDALGTTAAITNMNAGIIDNNRFAPFGEPLSPVAKNSRLTNSPWGYTGESHDIEAGLVYLRARYYEPGTGRFIQQDSHWNTDNMIYGDNPIILSGSSKVPDDKAIMQSYNLYAYGVNNPILYIDPDGELAYPGQIHNLVVGYVALKYGFYTEETILYNFGWGRADLISSDGRIWDVKRDKNNQIKKGKAQVLKYTQNTWKRYPNRKLKVGGYIESGRFVVKLNIDTYYVSFRYAGEGIIAYDYEKKTDWEEVADIATGVVIVGGVALIIYATGGTAAPVLVPLL
jgi:RHS repeat-associated protein